MPRYVAMSGTCFNPRSLCGERRHIDHRLGSAGVSIHAPYAGSDRSIPLPPPESEEVSIHAPYAGSDLSYRLSHLSFRVSIHAPYAGSDMGICRTPTRETVSIHAPYAGSDVKATERKNWDWWFQSTLPMRGATRDFYKDSRVIPVSIHAPYAGSDRLSLR